VVLSGLIVGALVVGIVSLQALVSQTSFRMQDLQARTATLQEANGELILRLARLSSPERIAAEAHRLGLVLPARVEPLRVRTPGARGKSR
jgi:cell division protein FtsL